MKKLSQTKLIHLHKIKHISSKIFILFELRESSSKTLIYVELT